LPGRETVKNSVFEVVSERHHAGGDNE